MPTKIRELCDSNFIVCKADTLITSALSQYTAKDSTPYIILESDNSLKGVLPPNQMSCIIKYQDYFEKTSCQQVIITSTELLSSELSIDDALTYIISKKLDYAVITSPEVKYCGIVTATAILKYKLDLTTEKETTNLYSMDPQAAEDFELLKKIREVERIYQFSSFKEAIVCYEPQEPISIKTSPEEIVKMLKLCLLINCNQAYADIYGSTKEELLNKQTLADRLPDNPKNRSMFGYLIAHNFKAENIETHETDSKGNDQWFLNRVTFELKNDCITKIWIRKRDITEQQLLKLALDTKSMLEERKSKQAHIGSWEYNFQRKTLQVSKEFSNIFELEKPPSFDKNSPRELYEFFSLWVCNEYKALVLDAHKSAILNAKEFSIEYCIKTKSGIKKNVREECTITNTSSGLPMLALGTMQDITTIIRLTEASLSYSERFTEMLNNSSDCVLICSSSSNQTYTILQVNDAAEKMIGLSSQELIKKDILDVFPSETGQQVKTSFDKCINENKSIQFDIQLNFKTGEKFLAVTVIPLRSSQGKIVQLMGIATDITYKKQTEENLRRLNWALLALSKGSSAVSRSASEAELIEFCCESITSSNDIYPLCCILEVTNEPSFPLNLIAISQSGKMIFHEHRIEKNELLGQDVILKSVFSKKTEFQNIAFSSAVSSDNPLINIILSNGINSLISIPLIAHDRVKYVLSIYSKLKECFQDPELKMFAELGQNIIIGIEHKRTQAAYENMVLIKEQQALKIQDSLQKTISALGAMLEHRDPYTSGHQRRVADLVESIAEIYGIEPERIHWIKLAASVHDIGKISVPAEILSKPSKLTAAEFALVKVHPESGYQILKDIDFPGPVAEIVRQHHEYIDGSGYPFGLKGNEILPEAKILTVADIIESMLSHRPYRPAFNVEYVIEELQRMRGKKLEPQIVDIAIDLLKKEHYQFPEFDHINKLSSLKMHDVSRSKR